MNWPLILVCSLIIGFSGHFTQGYLSSEIPNLLLPCYSWQGEFVNATEMPPLNVALLVELLRKIETHEITAENIRILTAILTNRYFIIFILIKANSLNKHFCNF